MKTDMLHNLAVSWTGTLNNYVKKEGTDVQKMVLGMEILLHNIPKLLLTLIIAFAVGILPLTLITFLPFVGIRRYAAGLHAENSITCAVMTLLMFVAVPYALQGIFLNEIVLIALFATLAAALYKYAPADTASRPIIGKNKRLKLKRKSVIVCVVTLILALMLRAEAFYVYVAAGATFAVITALPQTYKLLGRSTNNYEKYE